jgi:acetylornithine deacetylase
MPLDLVATLSDLVALPSVNPMGRGVAGPEFFEHRVTDYLEQLLRRFQIPTFRQPIAPLRENLLARIDGDISPEIGGELLLFEAHQDTVGVEGMTIEPWTPTIRDGRLYGRGSCDVKGGLTAMLGAIVRLAEERANPLAGNSGPRPTVVLACTVNEEHGFSGAKGLCQLWSKAPSEFFPRAPDAAVVAEPTELKIVVAHKGMVRWRCHTHGRAAHSSNPGLGDNAIYRMARAVEILERYGREILPRQGEHPLCGRPTLSVGTIVGGSGVNTVPDRCTIEIDHRLLPGDDPQTAWRRTIDYVSSQLGDAAAVQHIEQEPPLMNSGGLSDAANGPLADRLASVIQEITGRADRIGVPFGTDAAVISAAGVPTVVFGPGSIDQAHTADEWIALDQLPQASDILYRMILIGLKTRITDSLR